MLRVAHLLPNMVTGGRERIVADLCNLGAAHDIEPAIICYDPDALGKRIEAQGIAQHSLDRTTLRFSERLHRLLVAEEIDILHAQGHVSAALAGPVMRHIPTITTLHVALGTGWRWLPGIIAGLRRSRAVTAVSDDLARRFRPFAGKAIATLAPGVDLSRFSESEHPRRPDVFTIGIAARMHEVKRHADAIEAMRLLADHSYRCRLELAGQGPMEAILREAASGLDVDLVGDIGDMPSWLASLDAFLLPSEHEGTPMALLEALASGLPCIATSVGGVPALVGDAAILVPKRKPAEIAEAIAGLIEDSERRLRLSVAARARAEHFSLARFGDTIAKQYHILCSV